MKRLQFKNCKNNNNSSTYKIMEKSFLQIYWQLSNKIISDPKCKDRKDDQISVQVQTFKIEWGVRLNNSNSGLFVELLPP